MLTLDRMNRIFDIVYNLTIAFDIEEYPISMKNIILTRYIDKCILGCIPMNEDIDAVTEYDPVTGYYVIIVNRNRTVPKMLKRLNFTLAHELGHIVLEHEPYFRKDIRTPPGILAMYEEEANEFAGQFLMPEYLVEITGFNLNLLSERFNVSKDAAAKRLEMMQYRIKLTAQYLKPNIVNRSGYFAIGK